MPSRFILCQQYFTCYTGYQLLIQPKLVDSCSHMTLMHEKTLLIQPNFSSKKWRKHIWSVVNASKKRFWSAFAFGKQFWLAFTFEKNTFDPDQICFFDASSFFRWEIGLDQKSFLVHQRYVTTSAYWIKRWTPVYIFDLVQNIEDVVS